MKRTIGFFIGIFVGFLYTDWLFHTQHVHAFEMTATTTVERLSALAFGGAGTILFFIICRKVFSLSFFHGVLAASGFFASFDIVVFHWLFRLHRLTYGPEADIIEPILVVIGIILLVYAVRKEKNLTFQPE
ncbi:MAG: hypothetical protein LPK26_00750 [Bacillaceae bacterium]|nr:hypothetical protein [Bacillaceae bacterium]